MASEVQDSAWDLRKPWSDRTELAKAIHQHLDCEAGKGTRELAELVKCSMNQARAALDLLDRSHMAVKQGTTHWRLWYRVAGK